MELVCTDAAAPWPAVIRSMWNIFLQNCTQCPVIQVFYGNISSIINNCKLCTNSNLKCAKLGYFSFLTVSGHFWIGVAGHAMLSLTAWHSHSVLSEFLLKMDTGAQLGGAAAQKKHTQDKSLVHGVCQLNV